MTKVNRALRLLEGERIIREAPGAAAPPGEIERGTVMSGVENQILARLGRTEAAGAADVAQQLGVSTQFVQSVIDDLAKGGRVVRRGDAGYALSPNEKRRSERYRRLEQRRRPFVRW